MIKRDRKIGLPLATMLVAGNMIGSGVYLLPASLAAIGSITIIGWCIALCGALLIGATLAYLGRVAPDAGGLVGYAHTLSRFLGFQSSLFYWISCWVGNVAVGVAAIGYLAKLVPALNDPTSIALGVVALIWAFTLLNILGPRIACQVQSLTLFAGLIPIVLIGVAGWSLFDSKVFLDSWNVTTEPPLQVIPNSLALVFWAFLGLESASVSAAVVANPKRNVPLATLGGILLAGIVYIAACTAIMGMIPASVLAMSTSPFADAAQLLTGSIGGVVVAALAFAKASGTLSGFILVNAQVGKSAAELSYLPKILARVDRHGVPVINLLVMAVVMSVATLVTISPKLNEQFNQLASMTVVLSLMTFIYACIATWRFPGAMASETLGYRWIASGAIAICVFMIVMSGAMLLWLTAALGALLSLSYFLVIRSPIESSTTKAT